MGIWYNSLIRIENRTFFYQSWFKAGVKEVKDLLNQDQTFLSFTAFIDKYSIKTIYLEYFKIISAIKQFKKVCLSVLNNPLPNDPASLLSRPNICKEFYRRLIQKKACTLLRSEEKWLSEDIIKDRLLIGGILITYHSSVQKKRSLGYSSLRLPTDELLQMTFFAG